MELRQLRYFVTLAEELHFGRAPPRTSRQSALSQQAAAPGTRSWRPPPGAQHPPCRRSTAAGVVFLVEARQILAHVDRAAGRGAQRGGTSRPLRVGIIDSSYDSMPQILHEVRGRYPGLVIHQVEASVPSSTSSSSTAARRRHRPRRARPAGDGIAAVPPGPTSGPGPGRPPVRRAGGRAQSPPSAEEPLLLCRGRAGSGIQPVHRRDVPGGRLHPDRLRGTVESIRAAADLVAQGRCLYCVPSSCIAALPGTIWRPLTEPPPATRGRSCGAQPTTPVTSAPSSAARRPCQNGSAGSQPAVEAARWPIRMARITPGRAGLPSRCDRSW